MLCSCCLPCSKCWLDYHLTHSNKWVGKTFPPPIVVTTCIWVAIHGTTIDKLLNFETPKPKAKQPMELISHNAIKYLIHIKRVWLDKFDVFEMDVGLKSTKQSYPWTTSCFMTFVLNKWKVHSHVLIPFLFMARVLVICGIGCICGVSCGVGSQWPAKHVGLVETTHNFKNKNRARWAKGKESVGFNSYLTSKSLVGPLWLNIIIHFQLQSKMAGMSGLTSLLLIEVEKRRS